MIVHELFNAITMVSPIISLIKNWKSKSFMKKLMCVHIPISIIYHVLCTFPQISPMFKNSLRSLDFICIHMTSVTSNIEFINKRILITYILHGFMIVHTLRNNAVPLLQYSLFFSDNVHFYSIDKHQAIISSFIGSAIFGLYALSSRYPYCHGMFHIGLYWLYQSYFEFYMKEFA